MIDIIEVVTHALQISFIQKPLIYFKNRACRVWHTLQESLKNGNFFALISGFAEPLVSLGNSNFKKK